MTEKDNRNNNEEKIQIAKTFLGIMNIVYNFVLLVVIFVLFKETRSPWVFLLMLTTIVLGVSKGE